MSDDKSVQLVEADEVLHLPVGDHGLAPLPEIGDRDDVAADAGRPLWRAVLANPLGMFAVVTLTIIILASFVGRYFTPHTPDDVDISKILAPPGDGYLLGGDASGRDVFSMLIWGGRSTLIGAFIAVGVAVALGATAGLIAGYFGRAFDAAGSWIANVLLALPGMVVLLALYPVGGSSITARWRSSVSCCSPASSG